METNKKIIFLEGEMQSWIRNNIAGFLIAAFPPPLHFHHYPRSLVRAPRNPQLGRQKSFAYNFRKNLSIPLWWKKNSTSDRYPKACSPGVCLIFLSSSPQFPSEEESKCPLMEKGMLLYCCVSAIRCIHWYGEYWWEHWTVSEAHRPSTARDGWLWPNRLEHCLVNVSG